MLGLKKLSSMAEEQQSVGRENSSFDLSAEALAKEEASAEGDLGPALATPVATSAPASDAQFPLDISFVGDIRLTKLLSNHSGESDVWIGERSSGEQVAVKIYRHGRLPGLMDERQKCALSHANLLPILQAGEIQGRYFEVCPYVASGTLTDLIQHRRQLSDADAERLLEQLAGAIHYLHSQNVIHRDVKPSNVFVTQAEPLQVSLADFGTARLGGYQTMLTGTIGTVAYSSPEAVTGMQSEASDYWSLGMVLIEALTGRQPFAGLDLRQQLYRVAGGKIEIPEAISPRWKQLLTGLLTADYTLRWRKKEIDNWLKKESLPQVTQGGIASPRSELPVPVGPAPPTHRSRSLRVRLQRAPETIQLTPTDILEVLGDNIRISVFRYFWIALIVGGTSRNEWISLVILGLIMAAQTGFQFLPFRFEDLKREIRVSRQLRQLSSQERKSLRRMIRHWMKSVRDKDAED
ncbi:MAG TPA: serine/threonine-protein kinase [Chthoniobacterales bacterium]|nr:serine/threonine-protein kinase [Chthoniobacterales bacterium]